MAHLSSRSGGVKDEKRVFGRNDFGRAVRLNAFLCLVPPVIPLIVPLDVSTSAFQNEDVLNERALFESGVNNRFRSDGLSSSLSFVGSDNDSGLGVDDSVTKGFGRETGENDRVDSSETGTGEESDRSFGNHREVDSNGLNTGKVSILIFEGDGQLGNDSHLPS